MRDLPHHIKKLNRRVIRSTLREQPEEEMSAPPSPWQRSKQEERKLEKINTRKARQNRVPSRKSEDERNREMKHRVPIFFDQNNQKPRSTKPTKKKTPRI